MAQTAFMLELTFTFEISLLLSAKAVNTCHSSVRKKISAGWQQESQQTAAFSFRELSLSQNLSTLGVIKKGCTVHHRSMTQRWL